MTYKKVNKSKCYVLYQQIERKWKNQSVFKLKEAIVILRLSTETSLNFLTFDKHCGWTRKRYCGHKSVIPSKFLATLMLTFSSSKIYRVVSTQETFKSERFYFFLSKIMANVKKIFVIVCNSSNIYTVRWIKWFLNEHKLCMALISVYDPRKFVRKVDSNNKE